ncbi:MAG: sulfite exporter TauE/SafE family protein, partial [Saprospiraceae bacterium]|nr:sulfite exporter TauE/SafE family protein [Saprospiraceae bacterium]
FWQKGLLNFRKVGYICLASVPLAFLGGLTPLKEKTFFLLLGTSLVVSAILMIFQKSAATEAPAPSVERPAWLSPALGGSIGYLSGVVGIGGGIFLSPLLHLLRWDSPKHIAATASFFILVNSVFGFAGQVWSGHFHFDAALILPLMVAVLLGGQLGSRLNVMVFVQTQVRWVTAILVLYAGANILWKNLG